MSAPFWRRNRALEDLGLTAVRGIIFGLARGEGLAILGERAGWTGDRTRKSYFCGHRRARPLRALGARQWAAPGSVVAVYHPRLDGIGAVGQDAGLSPSGVGCLQADIVLASAQSMPMKAAKSLPVG
jgi:hypothetical protein